MPEEPQSNSQAEDGPTDSDSTLADGIRDMLSTTLNIGASMAKMVAEATSGGRAVRPPHNQDPINGIVHYSVVSVVNVVSTVASSASQARTSSATPPVQTPDHTSTTPADTPALQQRPGRPTVHRGAALRIPLSIENPGAEPMADMNFICLEMRLIKRAGDEGSYSTNWVRFEPHTLTVAPNDFEKLTVFIDVPEDASLGDYQTSIGLDTDTQVAVIDFSVIDQSE